MKRLGTYLFVLVLGLPLDAAEPGAAAGPVVELPPVFVDAVVKTRPWLIVETPGLVVLSRCTESITMEFVTGEFRSRQLLRVIFPESLQPQFSVPRLMIISPPAFTATAQQVLVKEVTGEPASAAPPPSQSAPSPVSSGNVRFLLQRELAANPVQTIRFISNLRLEDIDRTATFVLIDEDSFDGDKLKPSRGSLESLLDRRSPPLPPWLRAGIESLYQTSAFGSEDVTIGPPKWVSDKEALGLAQDRNYPRILVPMEEIFEGPVSSGDDQAGRAARSSAQAGLFTRWALRGGDASRAAVFWGFAEKAVSTGVTEELVQDTFKLSYADLRDTLSDYLASSIDGPGWRFPGRLERAPVSRARPATDDEVSRLRGEWERLEVNYVRETHPEFVAAYQQSAENDLKAAYDRGLREPRFLDSYALYLCDTGRAAAAAPILEDLARSPAASPRALFEASRIRLQEAMAKPEGPGGKLSVAQVRRALEFLETARKQQPPVKEVYLLIAAAWSSCAESPDPDSMATIREGLRLFPGTFRSSGEP